MIISVKEFLKLLVMLIPLSLSLGSLTAEIFFLIFTILVLLLIIKKKYLINLDKNIFLFLFLFHIYIFYSASLNVYPDLMLKGFGYIRFYLIFFILIIFFENNQNDDDNKFLKLIYFIFYIILFDALFQFLNGKNFLGFEIINNRISGIFNEELILGSFILRFLPILLWFMVYYNFDFKRGKFFLISLLFFSFLVIFITGDRTAFYLSIILISFLLIFLPNLRKNIIISIICVSISIFFIQNFDIGKTNPGNRLFLKTFNQITDHKFHKLKYKISTKENQKDSNNIYVISREYEGHFKLAIYLFKNNLVKGVGTRGFRAYCRDNGYNSKIGICTSHPHNIFLQISSELGLIGITFYLIFLIFFFKQCLLFFKNRQTLDEKKTLIIGISACSVIINFFPISPSSNFFGSWASYFYYFTLAMFVFSIRNLKHINM